MKFLTSLLYASLASASILDRAVEYIHSKRDTAGASSSTILVSREPLADRPAVDTVLNALQVIKMLTINSTYTIGNFSGEDIQGALAIQTATTVLNDATYNASQAVNKVDNLTVSNAETLGAYTQGLAYAVNASIATLISKKPAFEKLGILSLVGSSLESLQFGSYVFSVSVLQKIPKELQGISAALSSQIGQSIMQGIQCFNGTNSSCITTIVNPDRTLQQAIANETLNGASGLQAGGFIALAMAIFVTIMTF